jgi:cytochrome b6-f complex iron-sulfur subunit
MDNKICHETEKKCSGRREFLVSASAIAGGLVLSLANVGSASAEAMPAADTVIKLDEKSPLNKVGGSQTVETTNGKVVVARISETSFAAVSAKCTHSGGPLSYEEKSGLFKCAWHGSKFNTDGTNAGGPAKNPVKSFKPQNAIVLAGE